MAPREYRKARSSITESSVAEDASSVLFTIDNKPYAPTLVVSADSIKSIESAAVTLCGVSAEDNNIIPKEVVEIQGGITNQLFKVDLQITPRTNKTNGDSNTSVTNGSLATLPTTENGNHHHHHHHNNSNNNTPSSPTSLKVLVRIFGAEGLIDRDDENTVYAILAQRGVAPPYHGRFANGRLEGWLEMRHLQMEELPIYATRIAQQLVRLHREDIGLHGQENNENNNTQEDHKQPNLWEQLESWMEQSLVAEFQTSEDTERVSGLQLDELPSEIAAWKQRIPPSAQIAFCHNDLLAANILVDPTTEEIQLIDFEYGGWNFVGFDIANHFNEYAGGTDDGVPQYSLFPNHQQQWIFCRAYLEAREGEGSVVTEEQVESLFREVQSFLQVNHLYWGLWAVNQAAAEGCESFDYLLYAQHRIGRYRECHDSQKQQHILT